MTRQEIMQTMRKIEILKRKISALDYKTMKFVDGVMTEAEYAPVKVQKQGYRDEINLLQQQLTEE